MLSVSLNMWLFCRTINRSLPMLLNMVQCRNDDDFLLLCPNNDFGNAFCSTYSTITVDCSTVSSESISGTHIVAVNNHLRSMSNLNLTLYSTRVLENIVYKLFSILPLSPSCSKYCHRSDHSSDTDCNWCGPTGVSLLLLPQNLDQ